MLYQEINGVFVPKTKLEDMPRFKERIFLCYYEQDVSKFEKLVISKGGYYEGCKEINFLNYKNQPVSTQYCCIYQYFEEISMETLC